MTAKDATCGPHVSLDFSPIVAAVTDAAGLTGQKDALALAFAELEDTFGWDTLSEGDALRLPRRRETDFFGTGPFFIRARLLLAVDADEILHPRRAARLQAILDYLEAPPPIDSWKRFIVTDVEEIPLVRLLAAWGVSLGLKSSIITGGTLLSATYPADARALASIRRGEAKVVELNGSATA